jgi:hypothetical protein
MSSALIGQLIEQFPYEKVNRVMHELKWTWYDEPGTPSIPAMRALVKGLFRSIEEDGCTEVLCGGFRARKLTDEEGQGYYTLEFIAVGLSTDELNPEEFNG